MAISGKVRLYKKQEEHYRIIVLAINMPILIMTALNYEFLWAITLCVRMKDMNNGKG